MLERGTGWSDVGTRWKKLDAGRSKSTLDIITGDETWVNQSDPETKPQSSVWMLQGESPPIEARGQD